MKMLVQTHLKDQIHMRPGDRVIVSQRQGEQERIMADIKIKNSDIFDTVFIAELEPGDFGFQAGYIGGIARNNC